MQNDDVTYLLTGMDRLDPGSYSIWAIGLRSDGRNRTQAGSGGDRAGERRRAVGLRWARADLSKGLGFTREWHRGKVGVTAHSTRAPM
jgi:hypothetical protein